MTSAHHRRKRVSSTFFRTASWSRLLLGFAVMHLLVSHQAAAETNMQICLKVRSGEYQIRALGLVGNRFYLLTQNGYFARLPGTALSGDSSQKLKITIHTPSVLWEIAARRFAQLAPFDHDPANVRFYLYSHDGTHYLGKCTCHRSTYLCSSYSFIISRLNSPDDMSHTQKTHYVFSYYQPVAIFTLDQVFSGNVLMAWRGKTIEHYHRTRMFNFQTGYKSGWYSRANYLVSSNLASMPEDSWAQGHITSGFFACAGQDAILTVVGVARNVTLIRYKDGCNIDYVISNNSSAIVEESLTLEDIIECLDKPEEEPSSSGTPEEEPSPPELDEELSHPSQPIDFPSVADDDDEEEKEDIFCYDDKNCPYLVTRAKSKQTTNATVIDNDIHHGASTAVKLLWMKAAIAFITLFSLIYYRNIRLQKQKLKRQSKK